MFVRNVGTSGITGDVYSLALSAELTPRGEPERLTSANRVTQDPIWLPDGREIIFGFGTQAGTTLWRLSLTGSDGPKLLVFAGENARQPARL